MTQPLPYEPVRYGWDLSHSSSWDEFSWGEGEWMNLASLDTAEDLLESDRMCVTLANGQRIIVRALSEDRKAARAEARRARLRRVE